MSRSAWLKNNGRLAASCVSVVGSTTTPSLLLSRSDASSRHRHRRPHGEVTEPIRTTRRNSLGRAPANTARTTV